MWRTRCVHTNHSVISLCQAEVSPLVAEASEHDLHVTVRATVRPNKVSFLIVVHRLRRASAASTSEPGAPPWRRFRLEQQKPVIRSVGVEEAHQRRVFTACSSFRAMRARFVEGKWLQVNVA